MCKTSQVTLRCTHKWMRYGKLVQRMLLSSLPMCAEGKEMWVTYPKPLHKMPVHESKQGSVSNRQNTSHGELVEFVAAWKAIYRKCVVCNCCSEDRVAEIQRVSSCVLLQTKCITKLWHQLKKISPMCLSRVASNVCRLPWPASEGNRKRCTCTTLFRWSNEVHVFVIWVGMFSLNGFWLAVGKNGCWLAVVDCRNQSLSIRYLTLNPNDACVIGWGCSCAWNNWNSKTYMIGHLFPTSMMIGCGIRTEKYKPPIIYKPL